jgi:hypothetical protein
MLSAFNSWSWIGRIAGKAAGLKRSIWKKSIDTSKMDPFMKVKISLWMIERSLPVVAAINQLHHFHREVLMLLLRGSQWHRKANNGVSHQVEGLENDPIAGTQPLRVYLPYHEW